MVGQELEFGLACLRAQGVDIADGQPHHKWSEMMKKHRTGIGLDFSKSVLIRVLNCFDPISIPPSKSREDEMVNRTVGM